MRWEPPGMSEFDYFAGRAAVERRMAEQSSVPEARKAHLELAELHAAASIRIESGVGTVVRLGECKAN